MKDLETTVKEVILDFTNAYEMFTSLDISNAVKNKITCRHREVAPLIRGLFEGAIIDDEDTFEGYARTLIDVSLANGSVARAFLYYPVGDDPTDYNTTDLRPKTPTTTPDTPTTVPNTKRSVTFDTPSTTFSFTDNDGNSIVKADKYLSQDGRVEIPVLMLRQLGWYTGHTIDVFKKGNELLLSKHNYSIAGQHVARLKVGLDGRLKVPKSVVDHAQLSGSASIIVVNDSVFLK